VAPYAFHHLILEAEIVGRENRPLNLRLQPGDDGCIRDYVYIDDVAGANLAALQGEIPDPILNVGTGSETTTKMLADVLQAKLGQSVDVSPSEKRAGDIERSLLNADRLVELLGPVVDIDSGLGRTAEWFADRVAAENAS